MNSIKLFEKNIKPLCEDNGIELKKCSEYHFQLKGIFLINVYPTKTSYYIQGTKEKRNYFSLAFLISVALGVQDVDVVEQRVKRKNMRHKRDTLWKISKLCFVCGTEIATFEETTIEHKIPLYRGGTNQKDNLALSHRECNHARGNSLKTERVQKGETNESV